MVVMHRARSGNAESRRKWCRLLTPKYTNYQQRHVALKKAIAALTLCAVCACDDSLNFQPSFSTSGIDAGSAVQARVRE
jgi:hypothetical protein